MNIKSFYFFTLLGGVFLLSGCSNKGSGRDNPIDPPVIETGIENPSFENDKIIAGSVSGWIIEGDADAVQIKAGGADGKYSLLYTSISDYVVETSQVISGLEDGIYNLEFYFQNSGGQDYCYVSAGSNSDATKMTSLFESPHKWEKSVVRGVEVSGGICKIGITTSAKSGNWSKLDGFSLTKVEDSYEFLKGGDVSQLSYIEQMGGKFYDNGVEKDCFEILKEKGFNIVRLRLYNDPGNPDYTPSNRLPAGIQNPEDILGLARRAKQAGMKIQLTFHYSDYWTNAKLRDKPHDWVGLSYTELREAVYNFTSDFMSRMKNQGTTPEFVSLGNETGGGILFPDGSSDNMMQLADLFNQGYDAVKAVSPSTKVIIHLDDAGNLDKYFWYFDELMRYGSNFDVIGASYYPFWTKRTVDEVRSWSEQVISKYGKEILIMETGYNWNPKLPNGYKGQLQDNGPYQNIYPSTPQGQRDFLLELFSGVKSTANGKILGCLYWDPVFIAVPGVGWELGGPNVVSNTTLFDFSGNSLVSLDAFKYNN